MKPRPMPEVTSPKDAHERALALLGELERGEISRIEFRRRAHKMRLDAYYSIKRQRDEAQTIKEKMGELEDEHQKRYRRIVSENAAYVAIWRSSWYAHTRVRYAEPLEAEAAAV